MPSIYRDAVDLFQTGFSALFLLRKFEDGTLRL